MEQSSGVSDGDAALALVVLQLLVKVGNICVALGRRGGSQASPLAQAQVSIQQAPKFCHGS